MMMQSNKQDKQYSSTLDCIRQTYRKDGINGFWKGSYSNILRSIGSSLCLVLYDEIQAGLHKLSRE
jgi:solute carrier family 25 (adenine nucleotide translocator) protein 4/5/6/31